MNALDRLKTRLIGDRHSLSWKLPWLFAAIAALAVVTFGVFAYLSARSVAIEASSTRLRSALSQIRTVAELGVINQLSSLRELARDEIIARSLRAPGPVSDSAADLLQTLKGVSDSTVVVELVDASGLVRHSIPASATSSGRREAPWPAFASIGPLERKDGVVKFAASTGVSSRGELLGWILVVRQQRNTVNRAMAARLLEGAEFHTGNADGTILNPDETIAYPRLSGRDARQYERNGERWLSVSTPIPSTPWIYVLELPEHLALAHANALILPFAIIGVLVAFAGALLGQRLSRRITVPLAELTSAAESLALGDLRVPEVEAASDDEIGRLARAFTVMKNSVTAARERLEAEVDARTSELTTTAERLRMINDELKASEKLAALGRLSGSVGHELRNPLGVMSNVVFLIDHLPDASGQLRTYANLLREQIRLSDRIISDLLDRAKSGSPVRAVVQVERLLDDVVLRAAVPQSVHVERRFLKPVPPLLLDHHHLAQILWNLARNAVQAMNGGDGTLTFVVDYAAGRLRIEVHDTGGGVPDADIERVFEPMYTTRSEGIGLGLSISRAFARANGGDLFVGASDRGACFVLELPADIAAVDASPRPSAVPDPLSSSVRPALPAAAASKRTSPATPA